MNKRKKTIIAVAVPVILAAVTAISVFAYLQNTVEQPNKFSIGKDKVEVTEVFTEPETMAMITESEKVVKVKNTGSSDQFVRVYLDFSDSRIRDKSTLVYSKDAGGQEQNLERDWNAFLSDLPDNWVYVPETATGDDAVLRGYFYYTKILPPGEETTALIEKIKTEFSNDSNTDKINDFDIVVYSESVQTTEINAAGTEYTNAADDWKNAWRSFLALSD